MSLPALRAGLAALAVCAMLSAVACSSSRESAGKDTMTRDVGTYPPPPTGAWRPRIGVPAFKVTGDATEDTAAVAADQLTTLAVLSNRFDVIERAQLDQLLQEQGLAGVVKGDELAKTAQVNGVNYLVLGKITNFRVKAEKSKGGMNLGSLGGYFGVFDLQNSKSVITAECGVDLRLVDPSSGATAAAHFGEYKRTDSLSSFGVGVLGYRNEAQSELKLDKDNQGKILRLALDEALKKMLPQIDAHLLAKGRSMTIPAGTTAPATSAAAAASPAAAPGTPNQPAPAGGKFCSSCGKGIAVDAKFCGGCGASIK